MQSKHLQNTFFSLFHELNKPALIAYLAIASFQKAIKLYTKEDAIKQFEEHLIELDLVLSEKEKYLETHKTFLNKYTDLCYRYTEQFLRIRKIISESINIEFSDKYSQELVQIDAENREYLNKFMLEISKDGARS